MTEEQQQIDSFLMDYAAICEKHKLMVYGCGCCSSPFITRTDNWVNKENVSAEEKLASHIIHLRHGW